MLQPGAAVLSSIINDKEAVYRYVQSEFNKRFDISWLKPIGFNNAYALMMRREQARRNEDPYHNRFKESH
jgi:osmoprotectant transport system permease protein